MWKAYPPLSDSPDRLTMPAPVLVPTFAPKVPKLEHAPGLVAPGATAAQTGPVVVKRSTLNPVTLRVGRNAALRLPVPAGETVNTHQSLNAPTAMPLWINDDWSIVVGFRTPRLLAAAPGLAVKSQPEQIVVADAPLYAATPTNIAKHSPTNFNRFNMFLLL
jgi:hypothetical protein